MRGAVAGAVCGVPLLSLVLACRPTACVSDPALRGQLRAAEAWDEGKAALDAGDAAAAAAAFARARVLDPDSGNLVAWQARAVELGGDPRAALAIIDRGLARFPEDPDLRFNRAALRARLGDLDGAAVDLHLLISEGRVTPEEAAADPDLLSLRDRPELAALVPGPVLAVDLRGEEGSVLLGEPFRAELYLEMPPDHADLEVRSMGEPTGLLRRERVVEDHLSVGTSRIQARVSTTWSAVVPGEADAGPWLFTVGGASALTERMAVRVIAVGERPVSVGAAGPEDLVIPSAEVGERQPPWAGTLDDRLAVLTRPGDTVEVTSPGGPSISPVERWELRVQGQTAWVVGLYAPPSASRVVVRRDGAVVLEVGG